MTPRRELAAVFAIAIVIVAIGLGRTTLLDPWETHYAEVAREMIESGDPVRLTWEHESFHSKPALTPWLIAASLRLHGIAQRGGHGGELVADARVSRAVRLPFAIFGAAGLVALFWLVRRHASRRAAYLATLVCATTPFYAGISRQAITDMPMIACAIAAIAAFAAQQPVDRPLRRVGGVHALHLAALVIAAASIATTALFAQVVGAAPALGPGMRHVPPNLALWLAPLAAVAVLGWLCTRHATANTLRAVVAWSAIAIGILAKGPACVAVVALTMVAVVLVRRAWFRVRACRLVTGLILVAAVAGPWHVAMALVDGRPWIETYIGHHWLGRALDGVHGDRGATGYYLEVLGAGLWPWVGLLPASFAAALGPARNTPRAALRSLALVWLVAGFAFFTVVETKFHHYIAPVVPAAAILIGLWLDDALEGRVGLPRLALAVAAALVVAIGIALAGEPEQIIELFVYRHDRPWPPALEVRKAFLLATALVAAPLVLALFCRARTRALIGAVGLGALVSVAGLPLYLEVAAPHWGQRALHETFYRSRDISGVTLRYHSDADADADWQGRQTLTVRALAPDALAPGDPLPISIVTPAGTTQLGAEVAGISATEIELVVTGELEEALASTAPTTAPAPPTVRVDGDRLLAWRLLWRGETFWSGGDILGDSAADRTVFTARDDSDLRAYLATAAPGRRYFVITEAHSARRLRGLLPTARARASLRVEDDSNNKFTLLSFEL